MALSSRLKAGFAAGAVIFALSSGPAMAGRCGHSYPVDAPVTLAKVARACNVSLSALKEANPGVDPDYVTPGHHLAVPDEIAAADVPAGDADVGQAGGGYDAPIYRYAEYTEPAPAPRLKTASAEENINDGSYPSYFIRASAYASPQPFYEDPNLSYQKRSAARIRHAGVMTPPALLNGRAAPQARTIALTGEDVSPLMECAVLRREEDGKIRQVREFKPIPEGRETPAHCAAVNTVSLTNQGAAVFARSGPGAPRQFEGMAVIDGYVSAADADCVTVVTGDGAAWRVAVDLAPVDLLGKDATIWAEVTTAKRCGGLVMASAVYAEPMR